MKERGNNWYQLQCNNINEKNKYTMIKIEKVTILNKEANGIICTISSYDLNDVCVVAYILVNSTEIEKEIPHWTEYTIQPEEGSEDLPEFVSEYTPIAKIEIVNENIYNGIWQVPVEVIAQWNENNDVITDALIESMGFKKIVE